MISIIRLIFIKIRYFRYFHFKISIRIMKIFILIRNKGNIYFGKGIHIRKGATIISDGGNIIIDDGVFMNSNCNITSMSKIHIKNNVSIGPNVCIFDHDHDYINKGKFLCDEIVIENNVWIGANSVILKGTTIGENCVIGAGSVIKGTIKPNTIVYNRIENIERHIVR